MLIMDICSGLGAPVPSRETGGDARSDETEAPRDHRGRYPLPSLLTPLHDWGLTSALHDVAQQVLCFVKNKGVTGWFAPFLQLLEKNVWLERVADLRT